MSGIRFACPHCGRGITAPEQAAGRHARCPACKHPLDVPRHTEKDAYLQEASAAFKADPGAGQSASLEPPPIAPKSEQIAGAEGSRTGTTPPGIPPPLPRCSPEGAATDVACPKCGVRLGVPARAAGKPVRCGACDHDFDLSSLPPPLHSPTPLTPMTGPLPAQDFDAADRPPYPWETPPEIIARAEAYEAAGQIQTILCKVDEFLEGLIRPEVFRSIKAKAKQGVNLAELHVYPDLVGIVERPPALGCLASVIAFLFPFLLPLLPLLVGLTLLRWAMLLALGVAFLAGLAVILTPFGAVLAIVLLVAAAMIGNRLYESWARRNLDRIARRIRENPKSSYAVKQMFKRAGWVRWRTGIGRGQSGAEMTARFWQPGDVEQLIRVDVKSRLQLRSLLLIVMDNPHPHSLGWRGIGAILVFFRLFQPHRRIYVVDVEGGSGVADSAAHAVSQALGLPVQQGQFGWFSLTVLDH